MFVHLKTFLSHAAYSKSQDGSSLLRSALANERDKTNWGKCSLILPLLSTLKSISSVATVSLPQASSVFVRRIGCSFQEFHSFTYISSKIPSVIISFHIIFQSWHHQQLQFIYFSSRLLNSRWLWKYNYYWFLGPYLSSKMSPLELLTCTRPYSGSFSFHH